MKTFKFEIKRPEKRIQINSIKEAFDHLPAGVCFFMKNGNPILCNIRMRKLVFELTGRDLQNLSEIRDALDEPGHGITHDGAEYIFPDGSAWFFSGKKISDSEGQEYVQIIASDVTELHARRQRLNHENALLAGIQKSLRLLSENVAAETREKEILSMKMRVHDDMGSSIVEAHQILRQRKPMSDADDVVATWERAINLLRKTNEEKPEQDDLGQLMELSRSMGLEVIVNGEMPDQDDKSYLIITAIRECVTNAVSYAEANHLYVDIKTDKDCIMASITNDGIIPENGVTEGGGLSMLRRRIEYAGGSMQIESSPVFKLIVKLPQ